MGVATVILIQSIHSLICAQKLQTKGHNCHDFEIRFCCPRDIDLLPRKIIVIEKEKTENALTETVTTESITTESVTTESETTESVTIYYDFEDIMNSHHFDIPDDISDLRIFSKIPNDKLLKKYL